jgi:hypothetical protein
VSRLKRLIRALDPRALERNADTVDSLRAATKALRNDLRSIRAALADLTTQLNAVERQMEQLVVLRREEIDAPARMDMLQRILNTDRVAAHVRQAMERTDIVDSPVPHGITSALLPSEVYDALLDAIPPPIFFEVASRPELPVPPRLAPMHSLATWAFVADLVDEVIGPALITRFREPLDHYIRSLCPSLATTAGGLMFRARQGRIVQRRPGIDAPARRARPWDFLTTVLCLAYPHDGEQYGSQIYAAVPTPIPFRANSALTMVDTIGAHEYVSIPSSEPANTALYTYEFRIGPDEETRRLMLEEMDESSRRIWEAAAREPSRPG